MKKNSLLLSFLILSISLHTTLMAQSYSIVQTGYEYRMKFGDFHFMSILTESGIHAYRPHPGYDINGWGSTWYAQPFLPGAVLGYTNIDSIFADEQGIYTYSTGLVSVNEQEAFGQWNMSLHFEYFPELKKITGTGEYNISLDSNLSYATGDLNLFKIASNYLFDVPLFCDTINGETGDMDNATFYGNTYTNPVTWIPTDSNLIVWDHTDTVSIDVKGCYNNVDAESQGYYPIEPAYKPGLKVTLNSLESGLEMIVGGMYDFELGQDFWEDNVGITPLILASSLQTEFTLGIDFESEVTVSQTDSPVISPEINYFTDSLEVSIYCNTTGAEIFYTIDGSDPTITSQLYTDPFYIDTTTLIKAKSYHCELETSNIAVKEYEKQNQTITDHPGTGTFTVYPNPFTKSLTIECFNLNDGKYKIRIFDVFGVLVLEREVVKKEDLYIRNVNCSKLKTGLYFIEIEVGKNSFVRRIIKN